MMNNNYDREEPISLSEAPVSPSKVDWGMCWACGSYDFVRAASGGFKTPKLMCHSCYERFGS